MSYKVVVDRTQKAAVNTGLLVDTLERVEDHEMSFSVFNDAEAYFNEWSFKVDDPENVTVVYSCNIFGTNDAGDIVSIFDKNYTDKTWKERFTYWKLIAYKRYYNEFGFVDHQGIDWYNVYDDKDDLYSALDSCDFDIDEGAIEERRIVDDVLLSRRPIGEADER